VSRRTPIRRLAACSRRIDHVGVAVEDLDSAIELYEAGFEMELAHRETVESQGVEAVLLGHRRRPHRAAAARSGPTPPSASSSPSAVPGFTMSPTRSTTSTPPWTASSRRGSS